MIGYKCRISDKSGKITETFRSAPSSQALIRQINDENLYLISFTVEKRSNKRRFSKRIILDFTDTMALMLESGLSIRDALKVAGTSFKDSKSGELIVSLSDSLSRGNSFPQSLDELSSDFSPLYRGLVKIGDSTGSMEDIFQKLSRYLNDEKKMREKIQSALMYPVLVLSVLFLGMTAVALVIVPRIKNSFSTDILDTLFARFQLIISISIIPMILLILFVLFLVFASHSGKSIKKTADNIILKTPVIGPISLIRSCLNIMFSLEVLTSSGYPVEAALKESSFVLSNSLLKNAVLQIRKSIIGGDKLSLTFEREKVFPSRIPLWIGIGEASGNVSRVFSQLRIYFQGELDKKTSRIMLLIEPVLIVFVGILMILFVILFVVPLFSIFGALI